MEPCHAPLGLWISGGAPNSVLLILTEELIIAWTSTQTENEPRICDPWYKLFFILTRNGLVVVVISTPTTQASNEYLFFK